MKVIEQIKASVAAAITHLYNTDISQKDILVNTTKPEFNGDYTVVLFAFVKQLKQNPEALGNSLGNYLIHQNNQLFIEFNVVKGFLNLTIHPNIWLQFLQKESTNSQYGITTNIQNKVMVEYSSPNTNKPIHLGHLRNNFLGWSIAEILKLMVMK
jgi:arginyl-tRNA synthetase